MSCPNCRTLRAPNAVYCHVCGHVYGNGQTPTPTNLPESLVRVIEHRMSFSTAVTVGAGLGLGAFIVGLIGTVISAALFGSIFAAIVQSLSRIGS
jgi:hypothetical protein